MLIPIPEDRFPLCGFGKGPECCSYLMAGNEGFICGKQNHSLKSQIKARRAAGTMKAMGDHCSGPPNYELSAVSHAKNKTAT